MKPLARLIVMAVIALAGCTKDPIERTQSDNPEMTVDRLFTKDGCTVYRFSDGGYFRYFVRCDSGRHSQTMWGETRQAGKSVIIRPMSIPTVTP